jgi:hypothetical protein
MPGPHDDHRVNAERGSSLSDQLNVACILRLHELCQPIGAICRATDLDVATVRYVIQRGCMPDRPLSRTGLEGK